MSALKSGENTQTYPVAKQNVSKKDRAEIFRELFHLYKGELSGFCFAEQALTLEPYNHDFRFQTAFAYDAAETMMGRDFKNFALHHYLFYIEQTDDPVVKTTSDLCTSNWSFP